MKATYRIRFHTGKYFVQIIKSGLNLFQWTVYSIRFCWLDHLLTNINLSEYRQAEGIYKSMDGTDFLHDSTFNINEKRLQMLKK